MRLIDADELKRAIEQGEGFSWDSLSKDDLCVRKKYIDNAPTVEPTFKPIAEVKFDKEQLQGIVDKAKAEILESVERPHGKWKIDGALIACNLCGRIVLKASELYNYCPECGADMRGEDHD